MKNYQSTITLKKNELNYKIVVSLKIQNNPGKKTVDLKKVTKYLSLSICGEVLKGKKFVQGGQIQDTIKKEFSKNPDIKELCDIWDKWHLNDLTCGTREQNKAVERIHKHANILGSEWLDMANEHLKLIGLYEDRGYKYGYGWLLEPIRGEVIRRIKVLCKRLGGE